MGTSTVLIIVVFVLDLIAFGLGIGAEQRRAKGVFQKDESETIQWCYYKSDIATGLAVGALLFLFASQVLITGATRCLCLGSALKSGSARAFAIIFFMLNWASFIIAESCFLAGAVQNAKHMRYLSYFGTADITCEAIRKGTFAAGVAFTFFTFIVSVAFYMCHERAAEDSWRKTFQGRDTGVNMTPYA